MKARRGRTDGALLVGVGFTEVQRTADSPGFRFGPATEADPVEAAGAEASLSAKGRVWVDEKAYIVLDANAGAAWVPAAPDVFGQGGPMLGFAGLTVGFGL